MLKQMILTLCLLFSSSPSRPINIYRLESIFLVNRRSDSSQSVADERELSLGEERGRKEWMWRYRMTVNSSELHLLCIIEMMSHSARYSMGQSSPKSPALYQLKHTHTDKHIYKYMLTLRVSHHASVLCLQFSEAY